MQMVERAGLGGLRSPKRIEDLLERGDRRRHLARLKTRDAGLAHPRSFGELFPCEALCLPQPSDRGGDRRPAIGGYAVAAFRRYSCSGTAMLSESSRFLRQSSR